MTVRAPTRAAVMSLSSGMGLTFVNANVTVHAGSFIQVAATTSPFGAAVAIAASSSEQVVDLNQVSFLVEDSATRMQCVASVFVHMMVVRVGGVLPGSVAGTLRIRDASMQLRREASLDAAAQVLPCRVCGGGHGHSVDVRVGRGG